MEAGRGEAFTVIVNPEAGAASESAMGSVRDALAAEGRDVIFRQVPPEEIPGVATRAAQGGAIVGVAGGDGTLSSAAGAIAEAGGVLAPFPLGTLNHFARRLGIDSLAAAARAVATGHVVRVPLGSVNGRTFINHASAGLYPRLVSHRERIRGWTGKSAGNVVSGLYVLLRFETITLALNVDGHRRERTVPGLWVALGRGTFRLPLHGAVPAGRSLEVVLPNTTSRLGVVARGVRALWHLRRGHTLDLAGLEVIHTPSFTLEARQAIDVSRDGEVERVTPPIEFRLQPEALRVLSLAEGKD
jgi:undecaprenyl-diphosphatase